MVVSTSKTVRGGPWFLAEQMSLDFVNTVIMTEEGPYDFFQTDEDVQNWFSKAGIGTLHSADTCNGNPGELLLNARKLREIICRLVENRKKGFHFLPDELNEYLRHVVSYSQITTTKSGGFQIIRCYEMPFSGLGAVAEDAANLLTEGNFEYVRQCEHPDCTLWFYDRTKAHRRRWCSMALCGNRTKIAKFRHKSMQVNPV